MYPAEPCLTEVIPARSEPDYAAHAHRAAAYQAARPDTEIFYMGTVWGMWQSVARDAGGEAVDIHVRRSLGALMDTLESLQCRAQEEASRASIARANGAP